MNAPSDFDDDYISIPKALHREGLAALSGVETMLLMARMTIADLMTEMHTAARRARENGCDGAGFNQAITALDELSKDILARRGGVMELHRSFRALDDSLTPIRSRSSDSMIAYQQGVNFAGKSVKR